MVHFYTNFLAADVRIYDNADSIQLVKSSIVDKSHCICNSMLTLIQPNEKTTQDSQVGGQ